MRYRCSTEQPEEHAVRVQIRALRQFGTSETMDMRVTGNRIRSDVIVAYIDPLFDRAQKLIDLKAATLIPVQRVLHRQSMLDHESMYARKPTRV